MVFKAGIRSTTFWEIEGYCCQTLFTRRRKAHRRSMPMADAVATASPHTGCGLEAQTAGFTELCGSTVGSSWIPVVSDASSEEDLVSGMTNWATSDSSAMPIRYMPTYPTPYSTVSQVAMNGATAAPMMLAMLKET